METTRVLSPHDCRADEAEMVVLASLVYGKETELDKDGILARLDPGDITSVDRRMILEACRETVQKVGAADLVLVSEYLRTHGEESPQDVIDQATGDLYPLGIHELERYAERIKDASRRRQAAMSLEEGRQALLDTSSDLATVRSDLKSMLAGLDAETEDTQDHSGLVRTLTAYDEWSGPGVKTGFPTVDRTTGGLRPGWLAVVAGRPGSGKTWLTLTWAAHMLNTHRVMVASGEIGQTDLLAQLVCIRAGLDFNGFLHHKFTDVELDAFRATVEPLHGERRLRGLSQRSTRGRLSGIREHVLRWQPEVLVIDAAYAFEAQHVDSKGRQLERDAAIPRELRALALEANCVVLASTQINRGDAGLHLGRLAFTDAWSQEASLILGIEGDRLDNDSMVQCLKARRSHQFRFRLAVDFSCSRVAESSSIPEPSPEFAIENWEGGF